MSRLTNLTMGASSTASRTRASSSSSREFVGGDLRHLVDLGVEAVEAVDGLRELRTGGDDDRDLGAGHRPHVVDGQDVAGVGHGDHETVLGPGDREGEEAAGHGLGEERHGAPVDRVLGQVDELEAELAGQGPHEDGFGDGAVLHQQLPDGQTPLGLGFQGRVELGLGDQAFGQQHLAERLAEEHVWLRLKGSRGTGCPRETKWTFHPVIGGSSRRLNVLPLLLLLEGEEGRVAPRPVGRDEAGPGVVVGPQGRLAPDDVAAVAAGQRVGRVGEGVGGGVDVEQQGPAGVGRGSAGSRAPPGSCGW